MSYDLLDDTPIVVTREEGQITALPSDLYWITQGDLRAQPPAIESLVRGALVRSDRWLYDRETETWYNLHASVPSVHMPIAARTPERRSGD